jgi:hypothetical protein
MGFVNFKLVASRFPLSAIALNDLLEETLNPKGNSITTKKVGFCIRSKAKQRENYGGA